VDVHQRRKQKKLQKQALVDGQKTTQRERSNQEIHEEPNLLEKYHQRNSTDSFQEQPNRPISPASVYSDWSAAAEHRAPPPLPPAEKPSEPVETEKATRIRKIISENTGSTAQRGQIKRKPLSKSFMEHHASNQRDGTKQHQEPEKNTKDVSPQKTERNNLNMDDSLESMLRNFEKARGIGNEQAENDISTSIPQPYDNKADAGSIASRRGYINNHRISQKIEKSDPYYSPPEKKGNTTTHISQDVEKPGAALNSVSKENNCLKDSPDQDQSSKYSSQNHGLSNGMVPAVPPKSPRPSPRPSAQVMPEMSQATFSSNQASQHQGNNSHQLLLQQQHQNLPKSAPPSSPLNHHQPSPMVQNQFVSPGYSQQHQQQQQQQQPYTGQPSNQQQQYQYQQQYQQQQNTLIPQNQYSYSRQATQSPMMHPQRSPSMQPQPSPNMYPQRSPMMHPQPSPQPQHHQSVPSQLTPSIQPASAHQYGTHRGPPPSPINTSNNYACSPLPSPSMPYAAPISPGGILPPPQAYGQEYRPEAPLPVYYTDGTPILFWGKAKI
jgi:hypothetical protein